MRVTKFEEKAAALQFVRRMSADELDKAMAAAYGRPVVEGGSICLTDNALALIHERYMVPAGFARTGRLSAANAR